MSSTHQDLEPHAPLPDVANSPAQAEEQVLALWRDEGTFQALQKARAGAPAFVFWEGPPTANGRPGIHHVFTRSLKDAVCRWHSMLGQRVERKAGWDTHGLPVELEVEKALGISGKKQIEAYGVANFNAKCRESVWKYREEWERLSERIGYWLDYDHPYVTYEPEYVDSVWALLARFHAAGFVYRGKRVLPYCGRCGTALSSHELGQPGAYREVRDPSVTLRFRLLEPKGPEPESFLAWTTTPWTLPSNFALAVHPAREYVRARIPLPVKKGEEPGSAGHEVVWVVRERVQAVLGEHAEILEAKPGAALVGLRYAPLFDAQVPHAEPGSWQPDPARIHTVVGAEFVSVEDGTGIVHQAPYGADDWTTAREHRMPLPVAVGPEGRFVCPVGPVAAGTFFKEADNALMGDLRARGLLFAEARELHSYPHCWRCDTPLFYFPVPAWFLRTSALKEQMVAANQGARWVPPEVGAKRFGEWLENNVDWNISRDRYWGTPLPFFECTRPECGAEEAVDGRATLERLVRARALPGSTGTLPEGFDWHKPSVDEVRFACSACGGEMRRTTAVLDCWFDSGAMPFAQHGWPHVAGSAERVREQFPADFICEGLDQTRGWFYTLHAIGTLMRATEGKEAAQSAAQATPVYRTCLVNGLVLDRDGVKMSKRLGNTVDPWKVLAEHGADAVRWYLMSSASPWLPKRFDPAGILEARRRFFSTLLNSYAFYREYARLDRFDPASPSIPPHRAWPEIDRWVLSRTASLVAQVRRKMADLDLPGATRALEVFVVDELSNWYIRRNRRRFWKGETGADKLAAFAALHEALRTVSLLLAPLAPFTTELLWRRLSPGAGSVHAQLLPETDLARVDPELEQAMEVVQSVVVLGRALRERLGQRVRQPLRAMHVRASKPEHLRLLATPFATTQVLDELNIKGWGSLAADEGDLCRLTAKANFKLLGKRLGGRMKAAAEKIAALPGRELEILRGGGSVTIELEGEPLELGADDVLVSVESQAPFPVETDGRFVVWLDAELDAGLIAEGLAREVVSRVNALRKDAGLAVEERVRLSFSSSSPEVRDSLGAHRALIGAETLAVELEIVPQAPAQAQEWDLGQGRVLACALQRA